MEVINEVRSSKINKVDWKEFSNAFFTNKVKFKQFSNKAKERHAFMLMRTLAKKDPIFINGLQSVVGYPTIDFLHEKYYNGKFIPSYVFESSKQSKTSKALYNNFSSEALDYILNKKGYELKSFEYLCKVNPKLATEMLKDSEKTLNQKTRILKGVKLK